MFIDRRHDLSQIHIAEDAIHDIGMTHAVFADRDLKRADVTAPDVSILPTNSELVSEYKARFLVSSEPRVFLMHQKHAITETNPGAGEATETTLYASSYWSPAAAICRYETIISDGGGEVSIARFDLDAPRLVTPEAFRKLSDEERDDLLMQEQELGINGLRFSYSEIAQFAEDAADAPIVRLM
jgi:hypothetical protein